MTSPDNTTFAADEQTRLLVAMLLKQRDELFGVALEGCAGALDAAFAFLVEKLGKEEARRTLEDAIQEYFAKIERGRVQ